ncbi:MAG: TspO/MBR family protein [Planctomycetota bacterium]
MRRFLTCLAWVLLAWSATIPGSLFGPDDWFDQLARPSWMPPGWVFGVVWSVLYTLMGIAAWMVWDKGEGRQRPLTLWGVQLVLNAAWTPLFFGARQIFPALILIAVLWFVLLTTILAFRRASGIAAALLLPYLVWITIATALNFEIWRLNS